MTQLKMCPLCGGESGEGTTTFSVDYGIGVLVVRNVPALICRRCGESWVSDVISERLEALATEAREKKRQFEVVDLAA